MDEASELLSIEVRDFCWNENVLGFALLFVALSFSLRKKRKMIDEDEGRCRGLVIWLKLFWFGYGVRKCPKARS